MVPTRPQGLDLLRFFSNSETRSTRLLEDLFEDCQSLHLHLRSQRKVLLGFLVVLVDYLVLYQVPELVLVALLFCVPRYGANLANPTPTNSSGILMGFLFTTGRRQ